MQTLPKRVVMLQNRVRGRGFFFFFLFVFGDGAKLKDTAHCYLPWASRGRVITAASAKYAHSF